MSDLKIYLTGASGLLGRAVYKKLIEEGHNVYGTALSRVNENLHKVDITKESELLHSIQEFSPDIIIHTAAQRYPDLVEKDPEGAMKINVDATKNICSIAQKNNVPVIYISTDYVFDGKDAPYTINAKPNPVNLYGRTKLQGEQETLRSSSGNICLRVPVLYGPVENLNESAVTSLLLTLKSAEKPTEVSDYERRNPSNVYDIALICYQLAEARIKNDQKIEGIYQWCGEEVLTKFQMIQAMAEVFNLPMKHIEAVKDSGSSNVSVVRPYDTRLDTSRLKALGFGQHTPFERGIREALEKWV